jgi:hypothetical protein
MEHISLKNNFMQFLKFYCIPQFKITFNKHVENYLNRRNYQMSSRFFGTRTQELMHITLHLENVLGYLQFLCLQVTSNVAFKREKKKKNLNKQKVCCNKVIRPNKHLAHQMTLFLTVRSNFGRLR